MERFKSSNSKNKCVAKTPKSSGVVIREGGRNSTSNVSRDTEFLIPEESFKRDSSQYLPMANIVRIMRRVLPPHAKIADDAKEAIQECVSEFIDYITKEANSLCHQDHRKTITPDDVIQAMGAKKFDNYAYFLTHFLSKYRATDPNRNFMHGGPYVRPNMTSVQPQTPMVDFASQTNVPTPQIHNFIDDPQMTDVYRPILGNYGDGGGGGGGSGNGNGEGSSQMTDVYRPILGNYGDGDCGGGGRGNGEGSSSGSGRVSLDFSFEDFDLYKQFKGK